MYVNKCTKCGAEFETKNPKRVICPDCLYPEKNTISLQTIENSLDQPKKEENQNPQPQDGQGDRPQSQFINAYRNNRGNFNGGGNSGSYNNNGGGGGYNNGPRQGGYNNNQGGGYNNNRGNYNGGGGGYNNAPRQGGYNNNQGGYGNNQGGGYNNNRGNYNGGGGYNNNQGGGYNNNRGNYNSAGPRPGGFNNGPRPGGYNNAPRQGGFGGPRPGGFNRGGGGNAFRRPMSRPKQLLISREQVAQIEVLYKRLLPLPNPDAHEVIGLEIALEPNKTFFGINLVRQKLMLPKLPYPKRKLAVSPDQLMAIKNLYEPLLPLPPIGCHKILASQLKMDEWRVHVGIGLVRKQMNMPRWNPDRPDAPEEFKNQVQEEVKPE